MLLIRKKDIRTLIINIRPGLSYWSGQTLQLILPEVYNLNLNIRQGWQWLPRTNTLAYFLGSTSDEEISLLGWHQRSQVLDDLGMDPELEEQVELLKVL